MGLHYTEEEFVKRVQQIGAHYENEKVNEWEAANAFFEAAFGQRDSVVKDAFINLPRECYSLVYDFIAEQKEIGYESRGGMIRVMFRGDEAEMEARLAKSRPAIRGTCEVLERLLEKSGHTQGDADQPTAAVDLKSE